MVKKIAYSKLTKEVDMFLNNLTYERLALLKPGEIYEILYTALSKIAITYFDNIDTTRNVEINVRKDLVERFIELTGYIKVQGKFVGIDIRYGIRQEMSTANG